MSPGLHPSRSGDPVLSVVVVIASDTVSADVELHHLDGCLRALEEQLHPPPMEVIVPHHRNLESMDRMAGRHRDVRFLPLDVRRHGHRSREHHDKLRAYGIQQARGEIVGLLEDHERPHPRWAARVIEAHADDRAGIGGAIENQVERPLNWAVYFCDFHPYALPFQDTTEPRISDVNATYKRHALETIREVWEYSFREPAVNEALLQRGERLGRDPTILVYQKRAGLSLNDAVLERFVWGRSYAASRSVSLSAGERVLLASLTPGLPLLLLVRMTRSVLRKGRLLGPFLRSLPFACVLTASWAAGEAVGYATGRPS